jgi:hypothetical protein
MKLLVAIAGIGLGWIAPLAAQQVFTGGVELNSGIGEDQVSKVYEMKGPYVIRWTLRDVKPRQSEDSLAAYWSPHTPQKPPWISFKVIDAATRKIVDHDMVTGWENQMQIPQGGKHYLVVSGEEHVAWTFWGKEGKMQAVGAGDKLAPLTAADTGGGTAADAATALADKFKKELEGRELEARLEAVKLVASRSSSAKDFAERFRAYSSSQGW